MCVLHVHLLESSEASTSRMYALVRCVCVHVWVCVYRWLCMCECVRQRWAWVRMRADRGVQVDSLCNGGEGNLLDRSSSAAACMSPSVHPSFHRSSSIASPVNLSQPLFLSHLPSISHHPSCLMLLFLLHPSPPPPLPSSGPHPSGLMIKLLPCSSEALLHISQSWKLALVSSSRACFSSWANWGISFIQVEVLQLKSTYSN